MKSKISKDGEGDVDKNLEGQVVFKQTYVLFIEENVIKCNLKWTYKTE